MPRSLPIPQCRVPQGAQRFAARFQPLQVVRTYERDSLPCILLVPLIKPACERQVVVQAGSKMLYRLFAQALKLPCTDEGMTASTRRTARARYERPRKHGHCHRSEGIRGCSVSTPSSKGPRPIWLRTIARPARRACNRLSNPSFVVCLASQSCDRTRQAGRSRLSLPVDEYKQRSTH